MLRILVVEDTPINMVLAVAVLEQAGHFAIQAETAAQGIELAKAAQPDLILMDIQLPDMDGLAATRVLKADPLTRDIPVIAVTAYAMKGDRETMMAAGCDASITKPIRYKEFLDEVEQVAKSRGRKRAD